MDGTEIPPYFICPISLQIMKDPVTLSSGISYDRRSIERWISGYHHNTCPVTNQPLTDGSVVPNTTLRRLIESWVARSRKAKLGIQDVPAMTIDAESLCQELAESSTDLRLRCLKKIRKLVQEDEERKSILEKAGVIAIIMSMISSLTEAADHVGDDFEMVSEAAIVLRLLDPSPELLKQEAERESNKLMVSLSNVLQRGAYEARIHAALLLQSVFKVVADVYKADLPTGMFDSVVEILKDHNSSRATILASLSILAQVLPHGRNTSRAIDAGAVAVLVELLMEEMEDRRICEAMLLVLEMCCRRAEGRSAVAGHPAGMAAVTGKMLRVSSAATERAVKVLLLLSRHCCGGGVVEEMMEVGAVAKLCMVVQVEGSKKAKERAKEILGLHLKSWNKFPCFPWSCLP